MLIMLIMFIMLIMSLFPTPCSEWTAYAKFTWKFDRMFKINKIDEMRPGFHFLGITSIVRRPKVAKWRSISASRLIAPTRLHHHWRHQRTGDTHPFRFARDSLSGT